MIKSALLAAAAAVLTLSACAPTTASSAESSSAPTPAAATSTSTPTSAPAPTATAASATPDPCTLLTDAEVTAAFDSGPQHGIPTTACATRHCDYGGGVLVSIAAASQATFTADVTAIPGMRLVTDFGHPVYVHDPVGSDPTIQYHEWSNGLWIDFQCQDPEDIGIPAMTDLSTLLLGRI